MFEIEIETLGFVLSVENKEGNLAMSSLSVLYLADA